MQSHRLSKAALHAIAVYGLTQGFCDGEAHARSILLIRPIEAKRREERTGDSETLVIDFAEVVAAENSLVLRKTEQGQAESAR